MIEGPYIAEVATLIGDPARANMLTNLMDGRALTATELSIIAGITPQTASSHLKKMESCGLITREKQGRHSYFRLSGQSVADALEALMVLSSNTSPRIRPPGPKDKELRHARSCYDHLAGTLGVAITDQLVDQGYLETENKEFRVTDTGRAFFQSLGICLNTLENNKRALARQCIDWSERRPHLAGSLGAELLASMEKNGWIKRTRNSRTITITQKGKTELPVRFSIPKSKMEQFSA